MNKHSIPISDLDSFPTIVEESVDNLLLCELKKHEGKIIVLDDDPTGVQTVHDVFVYTDWTTDSICDGLLGTNKIFFILTNSRGLLPQETVAIHQQIVKNVVEASRRTGIPFCIVSRSDSTLRGHFPLETAVLRQSLADAGICTDGEIICPYFKEGGRFTLNNTHYVQCGDTLVPVAQTEFAKDQTFGFQHSDLTEYIEERTNGTYFSKDIVCISLDELRTPDYDGITRKLLHVSNFNKICVNAIADVDVKVFCIALFRAMNQGKHFLLRTAAGLVKVMGGITDQPFLTKHELLDGKAGVGGLVIVGSYTQKTTKQLNALLKLPQVDAVAFNSELIYAGEDALMAEIHRCVQEEERIIKAGRTAVCYTCREPMQSAGSEDALQQSIKISHAVQLLVSDLSVRPKFIVAKGGITSSSIGTKSLRVKKAMVLGQIVAGVPVWQTGNESLFPNMPYIIFPGNVGNENTLREVIEKLTD